MKINLLLVIYSLFFISFAILSLYAISNPSVIEYIKYLKVEFNKKINNGRTSSFRRRKFINISSQGKDDSIRDYDSQFTRSLSQESNLKYLLYQLESEVN